jgi:hypothetical protein
MTHKFAMDRCVHSVHRACVVSAYLLVRLAYTGIGIIYQFSYTGILPVYAGIGEICGVFADFVYRKNGTF